MMSPNPYLNLVAKFPLRDKPPSSRVLGLGCGHHTGSLIQSYTHPLINFLNNLQLTVYLKVAGPAHIHPKKKKTKMADVRETKLESTG